MRGLAVAGLKQLFVGRPLVTAEMGEQKLSKKAALTVMSSDALSSTAYATEEMLRALPFAGAMFLSLSVLSIPAALMIVGLLWIVVTSYSQVLEAYPNGGGAYAVAKENLGIYAGLTAGAALLMDYILTVAVSVAAGIAAITSAFPSLFPHRIGLCLLAIFLIMLANLRGTRESAALFAGPVYLFILFAYVLVVVSILRFLTGTASVPSAAPPLEMPAFEPLALVLLLRAFASGCTALTGVEAVADGVQAFKEPVSRNAKITLFTLGAILASLFFGITIATNLYRLQPLENQTILSQLSRATFGDGPVYFVMQLVTMTVLILAANTSFASFPRLSSFIASDRFLPRQFANLGDRLVFSNGIIFLGLVASGLVIWFGGDVHRLIPLYMVGVFVGFTLCQAGMVIHWRRLRSAGFRWRMALNAFGALTTTLVLLAVATVKFMHGAWFVLIATPAFVWLFLRIRRHYFQVTTDLSVASYDRMRELKHTVVVPIAGINVVSLGAIEYARSISKDVIAVQVNVDNADRDKLVEQWEHWVTDVPLVVLNSPYRSILRPLLKFVDEVEDFRDDDVVTVLLPEFVPAHWWQQLLHNQSGLILRGALMFKPKVVVTSVRRHLRK